MNYYNNNDNNNNNINNNINNNNYKSGVFNEHSVRKDAHGAED